MMQGKDIVISLIIGSCLGFIGCNASPSNANGQEQIPSDSIKVKQERTQQQTKDTSINKKDSQGKKQGLWIEDNGLKEIYYLNGLKNGVYKSYFQKTGKLEALGWYEQDKSTGNWCYFDEASRLFIVENKLGSNKEIKVRNDEGTFILLPFKSFVKVYHKNGVLAKEGLALYDEDIEIDFYMHAIWKYYDEAGKLIREENYKEGRIAD